MRKKVINNFQQFASNAEKLFCRFHNDKIAHFDSQKSIPIPINIGFERTCENEIFQVNICLGETEYIPGNYKIAESSKKPSPGEYKANGPVLIYNQNQDRSIAVLLRPVNSSDIYVIIEFIDKADSLLNEKNINKHYKYLFSCFVDKSYKTSMIKLSVMDKLRFYRISLFKMYIDSIGQHPPKIYALRKHIIIVIIFFLLVRFITAFIGWLVPELINKKNESKADANIEGTYIPHDESKDNNTELIEETDEPIDKKEL